MALVQFTAPTVEPVTTAEAKDHLRVDITADDALIVNLVKAARVWSERYTRRSFVETEWDLVLDLFPPAANRYYAFDEYNRFDLGRDFRAPSSLAQDTLLMPRPPLRSVTSINYVNTNGVTTLLAAAEYQVVTKWEPGRVVPAFTKVWPETRDQPEAVTIRYKAGFGTSAADVPQPIRQAILFLVGDLYENREWQSDLVLEQNRTAKALLDIYRILEIH